MSSHLSRRTALAGTMVCVAGRAWGALVATPRQTPGPFYPRIKPVDSDADLVLVSGRSEPARGIITMISGKVLDPSGKPIKGARIEVWQCDAYSVYHHPAGGGGRDANFQGYGRTETTQDGVYWFRTIRPVAYPGRAPHIHFAVQATSMPLLTTQMYVAGEPANEQDFILNAVRDPEKRASLIVELRPWMPSRGHPMPDPGVTLEGEFDIVLASG